MRRNRGVKRRRRRGRPQTLTERDKFERAVDAARWMIDRHFRGMGFSRRSRKRSITEQAWNHGFFLLQSAEVMVGNDFIVNSFPEAIGRLERKAKWYREQINNNGYTLPF